MPSCRSISARSAISRGLLCAAIAVSASACAHKHASTKDVPEPHETGRLSLKDAPPAATTYKASPAPVKKVIRTVSADPAPRRKAPIATAPDPVPPAPATAPSAAPTQVLAPKAVVPVPAPAAKAAPQVTAPATPAPSQAETELAACGTRADCLKAFRAMVADPDQSWMAKTPTPEEYATGMRLFAYRALAKKLECRKLVQAVEEITMAEAMLAMYRNGVHAEQARRVGALNSVVKRELTEELKARC